MTVEGPAPGEPDGAAEPSVKPDVSVILCVRNGGSDLDLQLAALAAQETRRRWELLVVDNGSTDDSAARAHAWAQSMPQLRVVDAPEKAGLAFARNAGAAAARGDVIAFCDADDIVRPCWLEEICAAHRPRTVVGGALDYELLNAEAVRYWRGFGPRMTELPIGLDYLPHVIGANFALARADYVALGGCDETFTGSSDELDLCWRAQQAGMTLVFAANAVIDYRLRDTIRLTARQQIGYGRSAAALYRKHRSVMPRRSVGTILDPYVHVVTRVHQLVRGRRLRGRWVNNASYRWGRIRGSIEQRVWYL